MTKELNEDTTFKFSIKTLIAIGVIVASFIGMYYQLNAKIDIAMEEPKPEVSEIEFTLKDEMIRNEILNKSKQLEQILLRIERIENKVYE